MGSKSDMEVMQKCADRLDAPGAEHEMMAAGARRNPDRVHEWAGGAAGRDIKVIIAVAGKSAHLVRRAGW